jgi:hypothetical protein
VARFLAASSCAIGCVLAAFASCSRTTESKQVADLPIVAKTTGVTAEASLPESSNTEYQADGPAISPASDVPTAEDAAPVFGELNGGTASLDVPQANPNELSPRLLDKIRTAVKNKDVVETELASVMTDDEVNQGGAVRTDVPADGGMLIGFGLNWDGEATCMINCMQPIYLTATGEIRGERCGGTSHATLKAKPGYAVGAVRYRATTKNQMIRGFYHIQLVFMRIEGMRLDPNDAYDEGFGFGPIGDVAGTLGGDGALVVGVRLAPFPPSADYAVRAFGLVRLSD